MGFLSSSIGKKYLMGLAGAGWALFVMGHMAGNLFLFAGRDAFNAYGHAIVSNKPLLYGTEVFLIVCLLVHVILGIILTKQNKQAKPSGYQVTANEKKRSTFASRTMAAQGVLILAFIIYHIATFKYGEEKYYMLDGVEVRDLYWLVTTSFQKTWYTGIYIVCLILLGIHLSHGVASIFQSLGFNHPRYNNMIKKAGMVYALVVAGGFLSQPLYVFLFLGGQ